MSFDLRFCYWNFVSASNYILKATPDSSASVANDIADETNVEESNQGGGRKRAAAVAASSRNSLSVPTTDDEQDEDYNPDQDSTIAKR